MKKVIQTAALAFMSLTLTTVVSAHVTFNPKEAVVGYSVVTVRVPNEKDVVTTQVRVLVPEGVDVHGVMPVSGWQYKAVKKDASGEAIGEKSDGHNDESRVTEVIWSGGRIGVGEFMEFPLSVQYSADSDKVTWKAYQTYAGGEVVPWDGSDEKHPAPVVTVLKESRVDTLEKIMKGFSEGPVAATPGQMQLLSVAAVLISFVALLVGLKKNKK